MDEYVAASIAPPGRVRKIATLVTDRKVACLGHLHFAGYALDPAHIEVPVFQDHEIMEGLRRTLRTMAIKCPWGEAGADTALGEFTRYKARQGHFEAACMDSKVDAMPAYSYWMLYGSGLMHLQWFAIRILAMVTDAGGPERFFSKLKWMKCTRRNRLGAAKIDKVLRMHYNMKLLERSKALDEVAHRPRSTLKESLVKDLLLEVEAEDMEEMADAEVVVIEEMEEEEEPASPE